MLKLEKLRETFPQAGIDGLLITSPYNRRYMSNFTGTTGIVLISGEAAKFITDFRYVEQASKECEGYEIVQHQAGGTGSGQTGGSNGDQTARV